MSSADSHAPAVDAGVLAGQKRALESVLAGEPLGLVLEVLVRAAEAQSAAGVMGSILLVDEAAGRLRHGAAPSLPRAYVDAIDGIAIGPDVGSCGSAAATATTVVVTDTERDPRWAAFKDLARAHGLRACWSTPIFSTDRKVIATFALYRREPGAPSPGDVEAVGLLAQTAGLIIERHQLADRLSAQQAPPSSRHLGERRIASLFEHAPAAVAVLRGPLHVIELANPSYLALIGGRNVVGKSVVEAFPEVVEQGFLGLLDGVLQTGEPFVGKAVPATLLQDGGPRHGFFDFVYQPTLDDNGRPDGIFIVAFEVTDLVLARRAAEASTNELRTFIDHLPELAWTAQPDGFIDHYNRRWYDYTGTTFEEMQGWGWEKVHDPALLPIVVERWRHSLTSGEPFEMEFTLRGKDGIPRWFLTRVQPLRDAAGKIVRWFGTNTDIDDIKASQALRDAVASQSEEAMTLLETMRAARDQAEARVARLEAELAEAKAAR